MEVGRQFGHCGIKVPKCGDANDLRKTPAIITDAIYDRQKYPTARLI